MENRERYQWVGFKTASPLGSGGTLSKMLYEIVSVKIAKQIPRIYVASLTIMEWTQWRGRSLPKRKITC
jgi:hypothetical protein